MSKLNYVLSALAIVLIGLNVYFMTAEIRTDEQQIQMYLEENGFDDYSYYTYEYDEFYDRLDFDIWGDSDELLATVSMPDDHYQTFAGQVVDLISDLKNN